MAFYVYHAGAKSLLGSQDLYSGITGWIYLYPPLLAQILMPLAAYTHNTTSTVVWFSINSAMMISTLSLLSHYIPQSKIRWLWLMPLVFIPFWQALYLGQITIIMMALLAIIWMCIQEHHHVMAGMFLALSIWIKVFPALLVLYFLWRRDWYTMIGLIIGGLGLLGVQIMISGPDLILNFIDVLFELYSGGQPEATYENLSIFGFASRLFQSNQFVIPLEINASLFSMMRIGLTISTLIISFFAIIRARFTDTLENNRWRFDLEYSLVIMTILMLGSTLWISGLPPLILIYVLILRNVEKYRHPLLVKSIVAISFILITIYQPMLVVFKGETLHALTLSIGFAGVMLVWSLLVWLLVMPNGKNIKTAQPPPVYVPLKKMKFAAQTVLKN